MIGAARRLNGWIDAVEETTLVQAGGPMRRWSWFQIAWAGLHGAALLMHAVSVLYHARRVVCTETTEPLFVAGCPAPHQTRHRAGPVSLTERRSERTGDAQVAVG